MKYVYETPNHKYRITKQTLDPEWESVFGESEGYNICMCEEGEWGIMWGIWKLEECFQWLYWIKSISSDERNYQLSLLNPTAKPLTNKEKSDTIKGK